MGTALARGRTARAVLTHPSLLLMSAHNIYSRPASFVATVSASAPTPPSCVSTSPSKAKVARCFTRRAIHARAAFGRTSLPHRAVCGLIRLVAWPGTGGVHEESVLEHSFPIR